MSYAAAQFEPLDRESGVPLYLQLADRVGASIESGRIAAGEALPTELQLGSFFGVSRLTVRQAMAKLVNEGFVHRARGRGTYVRSMPVLHHFGQFLEEELAAGRLDLTLSLTSWQSTEPPDDVRTALKLGPEEQVYELDRTKLVDGEPIGFERRYLPDRIGRRVKPDGLRTRPVYRLIKDAIGVRVDRILSTVSSLGASASAARRLNVERGEPLLVREQTYYASDDTPLMHGQVVFIGSRYRFMFECGPGQIRESAQDEPVLRTFDGLAPREG